MREEKINLSELEELKESYQIMNDKLESQEIITPDRIRAATEEKVGLLETELKTWLLWGCVIAFPFMILWFHLLRGLSNTAIITAGVFCLADIITTALLLRNVKRKDMATLDLNTLMTRERRNRKTFLIMMAITELFWVVFAFAFLSGFMGYLLVGILVLQTIPRYYHSFVKAYKDGLQGKIEETPTLLGRIGKVVGWIVLGIMILAMVAFGVLYIIAFFKTYDEIGFDDYAWVNYLNGVIAIGFTVSLIKLIIETSGKNKGHKPSTFTIVVFGISLLLFIAKTVFDSVTTGVFDHSFLALALIMVMAMYGFIKRKQ
jgi:hypothetical protein